MKGQGVLGERCAWCELPATGTHEVAPAEWDKKKGELKRAATVVPCCDDHPTADQPPSVVTFRRKKARGVDQLDIFGGSTADADAPRDAIRGDAA